MDNKIAHLGFIQAIISRMGSNSFLLKGWSVTLVAAIFALSAKDADLRFVFFAYFPIVMFWGLDSYFLQQERLFRALYKEVAESKISSACFILDTSVVSGVSSSFASVFFSKTLFLFYGAILLLISLFAFGLLLSKYVVVV